MVELKRLLNLPKHSYAEWIQSSLKAWLNPWEGATVRLARRRPGGEQPRFTQPRKFGPYLFVSIVYAPVNSEDVA